MNRREFLILAGGIFGGILGKNLFDFMISKASLLSLLDLNKSQVYIVYKKADNTTICKDLYDNIIFSDKDSSSILVELARKEDSFIQIRKGIYDISDKLVPANNTYIIGDGIGQTILKATENLKSPMISRFGDSKNPIINVKIFNLELDCENMPRYPKTYSKGLELIYSRYTKLSNLYVHGSTATGIGCDFLIDSEISGCIVDRCGSKTARNYGQNVGSNGIGIGVGSRNDGIFQNEQPLTISNCICSNNKNYGIVLEGQSSKNSFGYYTNIIGCTSHGNTRGGIGINGAYRSSVKSCPIYKNLGNGIDIGAGATIYSTDIIIEGNEIYDNINAPISINYKQNDKIILTGNIGSGNGIKDIVNHSSGIVNKNNNIFY